VGFAVGAGETMALGGESGSGKSVTAYAVWACWKPAGRSPAAGRLGQTTCWPHRARQLARIAAARAMIFQNPRAALNPSARSAGRSADVLLRHGGATRGNAWARASRTARRGLPDPARRRPRLSVRALRRHVQRVMIAIAVAARPSS